MLKYIKIVDAVGVNRLDSHQLPVDRPLAGVGNPPSDGECTVRFGEAVVGDPVAFRQKATSGGHLLKPTQTSTAELGVVQRRVQGLERT